MEVIPNGVDVDTFRPALSHNFSKLNEPLQLLFVGRFHNQKDVPGLIEKLSLVHKYKKVSFRLTLVGDGPDRIRVQQAISKGGLEDITTMKGWLEKREIIPIYQQSDCFLNLSHYEGFPNTVLEAMSCGLVIVASDIAAHRELIDDKVTGYLVSLDSQEDFSKQLVEVANNQIDREEISRRTRQKVQTNYGWKSVATKYLLLLSKQRNTARLA